MFNFTEVDLISCDNVAKFEMSARKTNQWTLDDIKMNC